MLRGNLLPLNANCRVPTYFKSTVPASGSHAREQTFDDSALNLESPRSVVMLLNYFMCGSNYKLDKQCKQVQEVATHELSLPLHPPPHSSFLFCGLESGSSGGRMN